MVGPAGPRVSEPVGRQASHHLGILHLFIYKISDFQMTTFCQSALAPEDWLCYRSIQKSASPDIERLEVVFGPSSALYGPNAHNGLLNVITKHPRDSQGASVSFGGGSSNYNSFRARLATATGPLSMKFSI